MEFKVLTFFTGKRCKKNTEYSETLQTFRLSNAVYAGKVPFLGHGNRIIQHLRELKCGQQKYLGRKCYWSLQMLQLKVWILKSYAKMLR